MTRSPARPEVRWQDALVGELRSLGPWIEDRFLPTPGEASAPARTFHDGDYLADVIARMRAPRSASIEPPRRGSEFEFTVGASRLARCYSSSVTAVAMAGLANGVGLDVSAQRCTLTPRTVGQFTVGQFTVSFDLADDEIVRCAERPTSWAVAGPTVETVAELREFVWSKLYGAHLAPLFERTLEIGHVSAALLWTSGAECAGNISNFAEEYLGADAARPYVADRIALFGAATLPGVPGPNPLRGTLEWIPVDGYDFPKQVQTRGMCCLSYLLEDRDGTLCQSCPYLPLADRAALVHERHGVPMGAPGGQATRRAQEIGRQRPSFSRNLMARS